MQMEFKVFRGTFKSWETLFQEAADFASLLRPERVVSISHSEGNGEGLVTVWYWQGRPDAPTERGAPARA